MFDQVGEQIGSRGQEFGATTGRPRRCGWLDLVALKHAMQINSVTGLCLTKLDVLDGLETINVCVKYDGRSDSGCGVFSAENLAVITPVYEELPGWQESTVGIKSINELPVAAQNYIAYIENRLDVPIDIISTGPDREETITLRHPFSI